MDATERHDRATCDPLCSLSVEGAPLPLQPTDLVWLGYEICLCLSTDRAEKCYNRRRIMFVLDSLQS